MLSKCDYLRGKRPGRAGGAMGFIVLLQAERIGKGVREELGTMWRYVRCAGFGFGVALCRRSCCSCSQAITYNQAARIRRPTCRDAAIECTPSAGPVVQGQKATPIQPPSQPCPAGLFFPLVSASFYQWQLASMHQHVARGTT